MTDAAAALVDSAGRPPRQGDGDDGAACCSTARRGQPGLVVAARARRRLFGSPVVVAGARARRSSARSSVRSLDRQRSYPAVPGVSRLPSRRRRRSRCCAPATVPTEIWCRCDRARTAFCDGRATRTPMRSRSRCVRRRRHPRGSGNVLLPRRAAVAQLLPLDGRAQHRRARGARPVPLGWSVHVAASRVRLVCSHSKTSGRVSCVSGRPTRRSTEPLTGRRADRRTVRLDHESRGG